MVFGMELGEERCRSENGEARTARRTNRLCTPAAKVAAATSTSRRTLTGVTRREATKAHAQLLIDVEHGRTGPSRSLTVLQLSQQWWDAAAQDLSPSTRIGYRGWLDSRALHEFGKKRISSVTTADLERWYGKLRDGDKPLSIRSVRGCRTVLSAMFTAAVRWGYLPMSPVERARLPKGPKWNPRSPEPEHVASRIAAAEARDVDLGLFARMAVALGARRGELAGLRWSAIDFDQGTARLDTANRERRRRSDRASDGRSPCREGHEDARGACGCTRPRHGQGVARNAATPRRDGARLWRAVSSRRVRVARKRRRNASGAA